MAKPTGRPNGRPRKVCYSRIVELYREGLSASEIARRVGIPDHTTVMYALRRSGADTRPETRMALLRAKREEVLAASQASGDSSAANIRKMFVEAKITTADIARCLGIPRSQVLAALTDREVKAEKATAESRVSPERAASIARAKAVREQLEDQKAARLMELTESIAARKRSRFAA